MVGLLRWRRGDETQLATPAGPGWLEGSGGN